MRPRTNANALALLVLATCCTLGAGAVRAQNAVTNGSFENTGGTFVNEGGGVMNTALTPGATTIPGWTVTNDQIGWISNGNAYGPSSPFGAFLLDLTGVHDNSSFGGVTQTISTTPSQAYTLSLWLGADQAHSVNSGTKSVSVSAGTASTVFTFVPSGAGNQWGRFSFDFVASSSSTPITIVGTSAGSGYQYLGLDSVAVVPATTVSVAPSIASGLFITAFPIPASGHLSVSFSLPSSAPGTVELLDLSGRCVQREELRSLGAGQHALTLALPAHLTPGLYFLALQQQSRRVFAKVSVLR